MYLEEIILDGFKSYANRTVISGFDSRFNAITGLNGSGKSNILDAICFVLGITNLSQVRVKNLQELVYKQGQAGITKATVTLVFNNERSDQSPLGYQEYDRITISRQVVIGGRNKYLIQGRIAMVNQVQTLFQSVQLNVNNPHFLIMQGHITKVLNMKASEILGMIEEACGTRLYETKKIQAQKTMEKKDSKVAEITRILNEDITPTLEKLRTQRSAYLQWASNSTEIERLHRQQTAFAYYEAREILRQGDRENRLIAEELKLHDLSEKLLSEQSELSRELKRLQEAKANASDNTLEDLHKQELNCSRELVRENSNYMNELQSLDREKQELHQTEERIRENEHAIEELGLRLRHKETEVEGLLKDAEEERVRLEELEKQLERIERGEGGEGGGSFTDLVNAQRREQVELNSRIKQLRHRLTLAQNENKHISELLAKNACEAERLATERSACESRVQAARLAVNEIGFDVAEYERVQSQLRKAEDRYNEARRACEEAESQLGANLQFHYTDPEPGFDRSRVKGVLAQLIEVRDPHYTQAVEVAAGGKLYQVVVDTEKTGEALLKHGRLQRRVTIIPLNRIKHRTLPPQKVLQAQRLAPSGSVCLALTLVGYDESVQEAIEYVFGNTLVCESLAIARKVAFNPAVRTRTVTVDGDVFEPSGIVEGGSRSRAAPVLALLASANRLREERRSSEEEVANLRNQFSSLEKRQQAFRSAQHRLDLELHNLDILEGSSSAQDHVRLESEAAAAIRTVSDLEREISEAEEAERRGSIRLSELESKEAAMKRTASDVSSLRAEVVRSREASKTKSKAWESGRGDVEELSMELEELRREGSELQTSLTSQQKALDRHSSETERLEARVRSLKEEYELAQRLASEKKEEVQRQSESIRAVEKQLDAKNKELEGVNAKAKVVAGKKAKLQKERADAESRMSSLLKSHPWLDTEEGEFGKAGGDYDFSNLDMSSISKRVDALEEEQEQLGRKLNKKVLGMMEKAEGEYQELLKKRRIIENDRSQIEKVIEELDVKKKETLATTYAKVNRDFGSIFSTLLPGASARLEPPAGGTVLDGLEVRVAFGGKDKDSLSELSGGQRSLLALSLVLSLLLFKPAPMYILDEVDAALDLSHTQNIGRMLRKHFGQSQFIVVSLKEGMFNNANVIFRTKFVDGVSTVTRTRGLLENDVDGDMLIGNGNGNGNGNEEEEEEEDRNGMSSKKRRK